MISQYNLVRQLNGSIEKSNNIFCTYSAQFVANMLSPVLATDGDIVVRDTTGPVVSLNTECWGATCCLFVALIKLH